MPIGFTAPATPFSPLQFSAARQERFIYTGLPTYLFVDNGTSEHYYLVPGTNISIPEGNLCQ